VKDVDDDDLYVDYDEFGNLPLLREVYEKGLSLAPTCIAVRCANATVFAYHWDSVVRSLQVPLGGKPMNMLIAPRQYLMVTGFAGDCRVVTRFARQVVLNHTVSFNTAPTGEYIAQRVSAFLQRATMTPGMRPFCCHAFVGDAATLQAKGSLHEVDTAGRIARVYAGIAGRGMTKGRSVLREALTSQKVNCSTGITTLSIDEAKALARSILEKIDGDQSIIKNETNETQSLYSANSASIELFVLEDY